MDYKKLIGTIIGVTLFAVLIAGATFAWLTFGTTLVSTNVNTANSMNFIVNYTKGTNIEDIPMVDSKLVTPSQTSSLVVVMKKNTNSVDGHGSISLTTTSTGSLTTKGIVRWAICRDTDVETGTQVDDVCGSITSTADFSTKALNTGKITAASTIVLLNDAKLTSTKCTTNVTTPTTCTALQATGGSGTTTALLPTSSGTTTGSILIPAPTGSGDATGGAGGVSYFVYFWLDGETISNDEKNQTYSAYIHASATQLQT